MMGSEKEASAGAPRADLPKWIAWEITGRCNLHCIHCRSSSDDSKEAGEYTGSEARGLIDQLADYASPVLVLSGGEPLLREDCFELARYGTGKGLRMCLATNGTLVDEGVCQEIRASGIRMVSLSLDGSRPEIHDDFRQQTGAFEGVMRAASHFRRFEIPFLVNSSFTKRNQEDIENVYRLAKELGAKRALKLEVGGAFHSPLMQPAAGPLAAFSPDVRKEADALKSFLLHNLYRHFRVMRMTTKARRVVTELFQAFHDEPRLLPEPTAWLADARVESRCLLAWVLWLMGNPARSRTILAEAQRIADEVHR